MLIFCLNKIKQNQTVAFLASFWVKIRVLMQPILPGVAPTLTLYPTSGNSHLLCFCFVPPPTPRTLRSYSKPLPRACPPSLTPTLSSQQWPPSNIRFRLPNSTSSFLEGCLWSHWTHPRDPGQCPMSRSWTTYVSFFFCYVLRLADF